MSTPATIALVSPTSPRVQQRIQTEDPQEIENLPSDSARIFLDLHQAQDEPLSNNVFVSTHSSNSHAALDQSRSSSRDHFINPYPFPNPSTSPAITHHTTIDYSDDDTEEPTFGRDKLSSKSTSKRGPSILRSPSPSATFRDSPFSLVASMFKLKKSAINRSDYILADSAQPAVLSRPSSLFSEKNQRQLFYIAAWYALSLTLSVSNKWLVSKNYFNFPYPLFTTFVHMALHSIFSYVAIYHLWPTLRPSSMPALPDYFSKVVPCGIAAGLDLGLSNSSLKLVTLSFYTMVKSAAPVFVLLFAFLFRIERPTWILSGIIAIICLGVFLMVQDETDFNPLGYLEVQLATVLSGLRWSLTQVLLENKYLGMNNPLATSFFLSPIMGTSLLIACILVEGLGNAGGASSPVAISHFATVGGTFLTVFLILSGAVISFMMVYAEYRVILETSVVTFAVAGIFKEIIILTGANLIFGDQFTAQKIAGLVISLIGIALYNYTRIERCKEHDQSWLVADDAFFPDSSLLRSVKEAMDFNTPSQDEEELVKEMDSYTFGMDEDEGQREGVTIHELPSLLPSQSEVVFASPRHSDQYGKPLN